MPDLAAGAGIKLAKDASAGLLRISTDVVSGRRVEATYADLAVITTDPEGSPAEVPTTDTGTHTDPVVGGTVNNSGIFRWSASPAGWERIADVDALSAQPYADAADASAADAAAQAAIAAELVDDLSVTETFGRASAPITGTGNSAGNYVWHDPFPDSATIDTIRVFGGSSGGALKVSRFSKSGDTFTPIGSPITVTVAAGVLNTLSVGLAITAGEYLGVWAATTNVFTFVTATADNGGFYSGGTAGSAFTDTTATTTQQLQIAFDYLLLGVTIDSFQAVEDGLAALDGVADAMTVVTDQVIGRTSAPAAGSNGSAGAFVLATAATGDGTITEIRVRSGASATLEIAAYGKSGDSFTRSGAAQSVAVVSGLNTIALSIPIAAGQFIGFWNPTSGGFAFNSTTTDQTPYYSGVTRDFTDSTTTTSNRLEVSFTVEYRDIIDVATRLPALEGGGPLGRSGAVLSHPLNFINNTGESLAEGSPDGLSITTAKEYDNVGFTAHASSPTTLVDLTMANCKSGSTGECPMYGALGHLKELLVEENGLAYTDVEFQLAACDNGYSGYKLSQIIKGTAPYTAMETQFAAIKTIGDARGDEVAVQASILTIGHNDSQPSAGSPTDKATFKSELLQFARDLRDDAKAATGQYNAPVLICSQVSTSANRDMSAAQREAANESELIHLACPMYQFAYYPASPIHITSASTKVLGGYYGIALKRILVDRKGWEPLQPVRHAVLGNTIDLFFNKDGLVFDTTLLPAQTNQGFSVVDGSNVSQTISSVEVISPNRVRITLSGAVSAGFKVRYGYNSMSGRTDSYTGGGGNLRDSQGDTIVYSYNSTPMHNWCVLFEYLL